jgi:hypothetical protein
MRAILGLERKGDGRGRGVGRGRRGFGGPRDLALHLGDLDQELLVEDDEVLGPRFEV